MDIIFKAMPSDLATAYCAGAIDAYGMAPERLLSDGDGNPCRHCLKDIEVGRSMLLLAYQPFAKRAAYSETGPIFLCADGCMRHPDGGELPPVLASRPRFLIRAYDYDDRIRGGTGAQIETGGLRDEAHALLSDPETAYVHVRSASNNCYQLTIERA